MFLHLSVSHSVHSGVSARHPQHRHPRADTPQADTPWAGTPQQTPPQPVATAADGTHPTGMLFVYKLVFVLFQEEKIHCFFFRDSISSEL